MTEEIRAEQPSMRDVPRNLRPYFLCLLFRGERWNDMQGGEAADLLPRHLAFLRAQLEAGRYVLAGPVLEEGDLVGVCMIQAPNLAEARALAEQDPGVQARRLRVALHPVLLPSLAGVSAQY